MTVLLTVLGFFVFIISLFTSGFKTAFKRLLVLAVTGLVLDVLIGTFAGIGLYFLNQ